MRFILKNFILILFMSLTLAACGGGGGGGGGGSGSGDNDDDDDNDDGSSNSPCANMVSGDQTLPEASITFPWKVSRTDQNTIVVRGTAKDISGIQSVVVNGIPADITCTSTTSSVTGRVRPAAAGAEKGAVWEAVIALPEGSTTDIVVEVTDGAGNTDANADQAQITNQRIPTTFVFDSVNSRFFGEIGASFGYIDILTGKGTAIMQGMPEGFTSGAALAGNAILTAAAFSGETDVTLYSTNVDTGVMSTLGEFDLDVPDGMSPWIAGASYYAPHMYVLVKFFAESGMDHQTHIFQYHLGNGAFSVLSDGTNAAQGELFASYEMEIGNGELLVLNGDFGGTDALVGVNLSDGTRTLLSDPANVTAAELAFDSLANITYAVGYDGVARIDMNTGTAMNISPEAVQDEFNFSQIRSVLLDKAANRLLIGDDSLDMILAVDITTGERSKFLGNGVGEGHPLIAPRDFVIDHANNRVFVADDGGNAPEAVFAIDLETGNRTEISNLEQPFNVYLEDIVLDTQGNRLLVALEEEILAVNLETEVVSTLSGGGSLAGSGGAFEYVAAMTLAPNGQRLLVTDSVNDALLEVNPETGDRSVISKAGTRGLGDLLEGPNGLAVDWANNIAYVASQFLHSVFRIDLQTGDRTVILTSCNDSFGTNQLVDTGLHNLLFDAGTGNLWMVSERMIRYNVVSGQCQVIGDSGLYGYFDLGLTLQGQLLSTSFNRLSQIDTVTGKKVVISK